MNTKKSIIYRAYLFGWLVGNMAKNHRAVHKLQKHFPDFTAQETKAALLGIDDAIKGDERRLNFVLKN